MYVANLELLDNHFGCLTARDDDVEASGETVCRDTAVVRRTEEGTAEAVYADLDVVGTSIDRATVDGESVEGGRCVWHEVFGDEADTGEARDRAADYLLTIGTSDETIGGAAIENLETADE
jgi:hypothetical protein